MHDGRQSLLQPTHPATRLLSAERRLSTARGSAGRRRSPDPATAELKRQHPKLIFVGSGYTYLQDWLPHTAQAVVREGWVDSVGLGRMVLSYPELPADVLRRQER